MGVCCALRKGVGLSTFVFGFLGLCYLVAICLLNCGFDYLSLLGMGALDVCSCNEFRVLGIVLGFVRFKFLVWIALVSVIMFYVGYWLTYVDLGVWVLMLVLDL